jgi:rubredoxin
MAEELAPLEARIAALDQRIERLRRHLPPGEPSQAAPALPRPAWKCPACGGELQPGLVSVHGTFWGFLLVGLSHQHCWFEPTGDGIEGVVIPSGGAKNGWRCQGCGFVGVQGGEPQPARWGIGDV